MTIVPEYGRYMEVYFRLEGKSNMRVVRIRKDNPQPQDIIVLMTPILAEEQGARKKIDEELKNIPGIKTYSVEMISMGRREPNMGNGSIYR